MDELPEGVVGLPLPIKVYDLVSTVEMLQQSQERERKKRKERSRKRNDAEKKLVDQAKALLMERNNMSEDEAHRYLQKSSMDSGTNLTETAQMILTILNE
jgi:AmiR/NasT family two-component response regulator